VCYFILVASDELLQQHFARFDESFFLYCDKELLKINTFFSGKVLLLNSEKVSNLYGFCERL